MKKLFAGVAFLFCCLAGVVRGQTFTNVTLNGTLTINASSIGGSGIFPPTMLGTGIPSSTMILYGDGVWRPNSQEIPSFTGLAGYVLSNTGTSLVWSNAGIAGPGTSTVNGIPTFATTTGSPLQSTTVTIVGTTIGGAGQINLARTDGAYEVTLTNNPGVAQQWGFGVSGGTGAFLIDDVTGGHTRFSLAAVTGNPTFSAFSVAGLVSSNAFGVLTDAVPNAHFTLTTGVLDVNLTTGFAWTGQHTFSNVGVPLEIFETGTVQSLIIQGGTTTGSSFGAQILAGTNASDYGLFVGDQGGVHQMLVVAGNGQLKMPKFYTSAGTLVTDASGNITVGSGGAAGGSPGQVQFNSSGALAGSTNLTFSGTQLTTLGLSVGANNLGINTSPSGGAAIVSLAALGSATNIEIFLEGTLSTNSNSTTQDGFAIQETIANAAHSSIGYNGIFINTPTVTGSALTSGYMLNVQAAATGMTGVLDVAAGQVVFGNATPVALNGFTAGFQINATSQNPAIVGVQAWLGTSPTVGPSFFLMRSRGTTPGDFTAVASGDRISQLSFQGTDGTTSQQAATIRTEVDAAVSAGIIPGRMLFFTANASGALTQALKIDSAQLLTAAVGMNTPGILLTTAGFSTSPGSIENSAANGMRLQAITGSVNDFSIIQASGAAIVMNVPTGTNNVVFPGSISNIGTTTFTGHIGFVQAPISNVSFYMTPTATASAGLALQFILGGTMAAAANGDVLYGLAVMNTGFGATIAKGTLTGLDYRGIDIGTAGETGTGVIAISRMLVIEAAPAGTATYGIYQSGTDLNQLGGGLLSINATTGVGYGVGSGGTVAQATNRTTGVTLNTINGQITGQATSLAGAASVTFTVTDSACHATDLPKLAVVSGAPVTTLFVVTAVAAGSFNITEINTAAGADTSVPVIKFMIEPGANS